MNPITPEGLALAGVLDEFYSAYLDLYGLFEEIHKQKYGDDPWFFPDIRLNSRKIRYPVMKTLNDLFLKYYYLFVPNKDIIIWDKDIYYDFFIVYYHIKPKEKYRYHEKGFLQAQTGKWAIISFNAFLINISNILAKMLIIYEKKEGRKTSFSDCIEKIAQHFKVSSEMLGKEIIVPEDKIVPITNKPLFIFKNLTTTSCSRQNHNLKSARYVAKHTLDSSQFLLPTHYCESCEKYLIGEYSLRLYEKTFGRFLLDRKQDSEVSTGLKTMSPESKLHELGYNVEQGGPNKTERQRLLIKVLENKYLTYFQVCSTIENNIRLFSTRPRYIDAVHKWQDDLKFIGDYVLEHPELK